MKQIYHEVQREKEVRAIVEEIVCNPDDYDISKTVAEICNLFQHDVELAENAEDFRKCQTAGLVDWRG